MIPTIEGDVRIPNLVGCCLQLNTSPLPSRVWYTITVASVKTPCFHTFRNKCRMANSPRCLCIAYHVLQISVTALKSRACQQSYPTDEADDSAYC